MSQPGPQGLPKTNPEELALAESIADKLAYRDECFWDLIRDAALSAIQQTTELVRNATLEEAADKVSETVSLEFRGFWTPEEIADEIPAIIRSLRRNDHLKQEAV